VHRPSNGLAFQGFYSGTEESKGTGFPQQLYMYAEIKIQTQYAAPGDFVPTL